MCKKIFILVRHAESYGNVANIESFRNGNDEFYQKYRIDKVPSSKWNLTKCGILQATRTGLWIQRNVSTVFKAMFVSPYKRTIDTANFFPFPKNSWRSNLDLQERNYGGLERLSLPQWHKETAKQNIPTFEDSLDWKPNGGESARELMRRVRHFFVSYQNTFGSTNIIVTHGDFINTLRFMLFDLPDSKYKDFKSLRGGYTHYCHVFMFEDVDYILSGEKQSCKHKEVSFFIDTNNTWCKRILRTSDF